MNQNDDNAAPAGEDLPVATENNTFTCARCEKITLISEKILCINHDCGKEYCSKCIRRSISARNKMRIKRIKAWVCWSCGTKNKLSKYFWNYLTNFSCRKPQVQEPIVINDSNESEKDQPESKVEAPRSSSRNRTQAKVLSYVRCHECNVQDIADNFVACKNAICNLYFCTKCVKKYEAFSSTLIIKQQGVKFNEDLKRYRQEGWTCVVCRELCKCKKCKKLVQEDLQKLDPSPQKPNDVVPYPMRGKRAFQVDNFVILEETFSHEERKAKQAAKKAVQQQPAKRQSYHAEVFKTVSKRAVKRLKHNSNPGSYNSIRSESEEEPAPAPKPNPSRAFPTYSSAIPPVMGQQPPLGYTNVYPQMDLAASYAPGCYYITTEPRYYIPTVAPQQYVQQYVQQYTQQFNVMAPPSGYTMAPFAYYSMPQFKPVVPDQPQYRQPFTFSQVLFYCSYTCRHQEKDVQKVRKSSSRILRITRNKQRRQHYRHQTRQQGLRGM
eukprot:TRINITY_DN242_c0_g1_i2.p1 TRINITY_DN242_c0_g1~~TRINITY_DN242_c0_g1_i2.p1  ORF type:complete len:518 (+),score=24.94 TRINITY_DN242_c0_g1_i2:74-1555(+)